jgi:hypothetical protein
MFDKFLFFNNIRHREWERPSLRHIFSFKFISNVIHWSPAVRALTVLACRPDTPQRTIHIGRASINRGPCARLRDSNQRCWFSIWAFA